MFTRVVHRVRKIFTADAYSPNRNTPTGYQTLIFVPFGKGDWHASKRSRSSNDCDWVGCFRL